MDANSKMNFLNNLPAGDVISCPVCGTANKATKEKCFVCSAVLKTAAQTGAPAATAVEQVSFKAVAEEKHPPVGKTVEKLPPISKAEKNAPAFGTMEEKLPSVGEVEDKSPAFGAVEEKNPKSKTPAIPRVEEDDDRTEVCAFAQGLPKWSLEPPQVAIRRR